jgi:hypothetical protein
VIDVSIDVDALTEKLAAELEALKAFVPEMAEELTDWQRQDMHRQYPNTQEDQDSASTDIWPRSRLSEEAVQKERANRRAYFMRRQRSIRNVGPRRQPGGGQRYRSQRQILRDVLFDQLEDRMDALMIEKLGWP